MVMYRTSAIGRGMFPQIQRTFSPQFLTENGFENMGNCWGNMNYNYWKIDSEIGTICVVDYREVWLERGMREQKLEKIDSPKMLKLLIGMFS